MSLQKDQNLKNAFDVIGEACVIHSDLGVITFNNGEMGNGGNIFGDTFEDAIFAPANS